MPFHWPSAFNRRTNNNMYDYYNVNSYNDLMFDAFPPSTVTQPKLIPDTRNRIHWRMLILWFVVLIVGFVISSLLCKDTEFDECAPLDPLIQVRNLIDMLVYSIPIFFIGYIYTDECNKFKKPYFIPLILISITAFGFISWLPFLHVSLQRTSVEYQWTWPTYIVIIVASLLIGALIAYHLRIAFKIQSHSKFKYGYKYLIHVLVFIGFYIGSYVYLLMTFPIVQLHFHHWFIFWSLSMFAQFNTHISIACQAICIGIFVQGASAYGITDTIFQV